MIPDVTHGMVEDAPPRRLRKLNAAPPQALPAPSESASDRRAAFGLCGPDEIIGGDLMGLNSAPV